MCSLASLNLLLLQGETDFGCFTYKFKFVFPVHTNKAVCTANSVSKSHSGAYRHLFIVKNNLLLLLIYLGLNQSCYSVKQG